jgi:hypothetical protein
MPVRYQRCDGCCNGHQIKASPKAAVKSYRWREEIRADPESSCKKNGRSGDV